MKKMKGRKYHYLLTPYLVKIYLIIFIFIVLYAVYYRSLLSSGNKINNQKNSDNQNNNGNPKNNINIKEGFKNEEKKKERFQSEKDTNNSKETNKGKNNKTNNNDKVNNKGEQNKNWKEQYLLVKNNEIAAKSKEKLLKQELESKEKEINSIKDKYDDKLKLIEKVLTTQDGDTSSFEAIKKLVDENQQTNSKLKNLKNINKTILDSKNLENNLDKLFSENETERQEIAQQMNLVEDNYNNLIKSSQELLLKKENEKLAKYNKNLNDHLENERKKKTSIDLLQVGGDIESGLMSAAKYIDKLFNNDNSNNKGRKTGKEGFTNYNASNTYQDSYEFICDSNSSIQSRYFGEPVSNDLITVEPFISEGWQESGGESKETNNSLKQLSDKLGKNSNKNSNKTSKNNEEGDMEGLFDYILSLVEYATGTSMVSLKNNFKDLTGVLIKDNNIISTGFLFVFLAFILFFINITM